MVLNLLRRSKTCSRYRSLPTLVKLISTLLPILAHVESGHNPHAIGDGGDAIGIYQIHREYWRDGCHIMGVNWPYSEARNPAKAARVVSAYLGHYGALYERQTGRRATLEVLCRIHNGGPDGWKKRATLTYWGKCRAAPIQGR